MLKTAPKRPFLDTKSAIAQAKQLITARNLFVVMRLCSPVVLSYLDAGYEPWCGRNDFLTACCCLLLLLLLLLAKTCSSSRLELGLSWVLVLLNALEITVEERALALETCLDGQDDCLETRLKNGPFSPQNRPPCGTTAWYMPH